MKNKNTIIGAVLLVAAIVALVLTNHTNILLAIFMIGVVICFHEFGHFLVARINGVTVREFSLGMGPRLLSWHMMGTRWSLKLLPFGGSCLMLGENDAIMVETESSSEEAEDGAEEVSVLGAESAENAGADKTGAGEPAEKEPEEGSFGSKNVWQRISIIFAGPFFNFILAFLLACIIIGSIGYDPALVDGVSEEVAAETGLAKGDTILEYDGHSITVGRDVALYTQFDDIPENVTIKFRKEDGTEVEKTYASKLISKYLCGISYTASNSPMTLSETSGAAAKAGMRGGDTIISVNGVEIASGLAFMDYTEKNPIGDDVMHFVVQRDGKELTFDVQPILTQERQLGFSYNANYIREKAGFFGTIGYGLHEVGYWIKATVKSLGYLLSGKASRKDVGGVVRIVDEIGDVVEESYEEDGAFYSFLNLINWGVLLSANLGVMNLLPIPALDGGRLLFLIIEAIRGKKANPKVEGYITLAGFVLLMLLMVIILFNDISNVFGMILPR